MLVESLSASIEVKLNAEGFVLGWCRRGPPDGVVNANIHGAVQLYDITFDQAGTAKEVMLIEVISTRRVGAGQIQPMPS